MVATYDAIVLGTGGVGSAGLMHLAQRGLRVLGIDRFPGGHDRGSSHGDTRVIRQAYFEHSSYVPLLLRAYHLWEQLEQQAGEQLLHRVGLLYVGPSTAEVISGVRASAAEHSLEIQSLSASEIPKRFPGFHAEESMVGLFEPQAGYLLVERSVLAHLAAAERSGAELHTGESVVTWRSRGNGIELQTDRATYHAGRLIITAGPWAASLLASLGLPLTVRRKHLHWFGPAAAPYRAADGCPNYLFDLPGGIYYGFPAIDAQGIKVAEHSGGTPIVDPLHDRREIEVDQQLRVAEFVGTCLPLAGRTSLRHSVCYYTMTPDEHFIIDHHPNDQRVVFAAGLSGHGYKFASVLGEALADLAINGKSLLPLDFLRLNRPALNSSRQ